jgi:hypothetical protein
MSAVKIVGCGVGKRNFVEVVAPGRATGRWHHGGGGLLKLLPVCHDSNPERKDDHENLKRKGNGAAMTTPRAPDNTKNGEEGEGGLFRPLVLAEKPRRTHALLSSKWD